MMRKTVRPKKKQQHEQRNKAKKKTTTWRKAECEEMEKGESGARAKLEPHFILDLRFLFFLGLMVVPTKKNSLVTSYISTHNSFFFFCNGLHWHPQFCSDPPNNLHPKPKSLSYPYPSMDLLSALDIIFSKNIFYLNIIWLDIIILISRGFQKWYPGRYPVRISKFSRYLPNTGSNLKVHCVC